MTTLMLFALDTKDPWIFLKYIPPPAAPNYLQSFIVRESLDL